ncbi:MAG: acyltransferase [Terracidiphilus sp.]
MSAGGRNFGLDALRAAAILGVFLCHEVGVKVAGASIFYSLGSGVDLFFVLSGFLIGGICFRSLSKDDFSIWKFWRSRWWRTLPPYAAAILFYLALRPFCTKLPPIYPYYGVFLQNYLGVLGVGPSWSLCVEEHFYLCLPILVLVVIRLVGIRELGFLLPVLFFVPLALRLGTYWIEGGMPSQWYWMTHLHCEGLIGGVWMSYLSVFDRPRFDSLKRQSRWFLPIPLALVLVLTYWSSQPVLFDLLVNTLYALGFAAWLRHLYELRWNPVTRVGKLVRWCISGTALCSYSIYLTHTIVDPWLRMQLASLLTRGGVRSFIVLSATWFAGVIFYFLIERPTIITRDHYLKKIKMPAIRVPLPQEGDAA